MILGTLPVSVPLLHARFPRVLMPKTNHAGAAITVEQVAEADFPSRYGNFKICGFRAHSESREQEIVVLKVGDLSGKGAAPMLRIHSQCLTGEVFASLRCDCGPQLQMALRMIGESGCGLLIYDPQEGRGIGLLNKLMAYQLQDEGADTVEANQMLGFEADERDYGFAVAILRQFELSEVRFLSNNPDKVAALELGGIRVVERIPCEPESGDQASAYLRTKKEKLGHLIDAR
jgi:GTP cyclohydrolase II